LLEQKLDLLILSFVALIDTLGHQGLATDFCNVEGVWYINESILAEQIYSTSNKAIRSIRAFVLGSSC